MGKWFLALSFIACKAVAFQSAIALEGIPCAFTISAHELTQIVVQNDRIIGVKSALDSLAIEREETLGHLFIKPHVKTEQPIQLFLITEQGKTIELRLTMADVPGETIKIEAPETTLPTSAASISFEQTLAEIIVALHQRTPLPGYDSITPEPEPLLLPRCIAHEVARVQGERFVAIEYSVHSLSHRTVHVRERDFNAPSVLAIAIEKPRLSKNESTRVYIVRER